MTEAEIKSKLLEEDTGMQGSELPQGTQVTATNMLIAMLDMEERQSVYLIIFLVSYSC